MGNQPSKEQSATESESKLWLASKGYLRGDINIERLEEIELPHASDFKAATLAQARSQMRTFIVIILALGFLISITVGIVISFISKNAFALAFSAVPLIFTPVVIDYILPMDERRFKIQAEKIQLKEQKHLKARQTD